MATELIDFKDLETSRIIFGHPTPIRNSTNTIINLMIENEEGRLSDLIINTPPQLMSFGVQEIKDRNTQQLVGLQLPICIYGKNGPTDDEKKFVGTINDISNHCKDFVLANKKDFGREDITEDDLGKINPLVWKYENGVVLEKRGPILYVKLIINHRNNHVMSMFINEETNQEIDPYSLINKKFLATAALKLENIFIGNRISIHIKLYEVLVRFITPRQRNVYQPTSILRPQIAIKTKHDENNNHHKKKQVIKQQHHEENNNQTNPFSVLDNEEVEEEIV